MRDSSQSTHGAGNDHHRIRRVGAAGEGSVHALEIVRRGAFGQTQPPLQLLGNDRLSVIAQHHMNLMPAGIEIIEQSLSVKQTAGAGDGNDYFQRP